MKWFVNLPIRVKFFAAFAVVITILLVVIVTAKRGITRIEDFQKDIFYSEFANSVDLLRLRSNEDEIRLALVMMTNAADRTAKEQLHQDIKEYALSIEKRMQGLIERNRGDTVLLNRFEELNAVRLAFKETRDTQIIPLIYDGKLDDAKKLAFGIQTERFEKIRSLTNELVRYANEEAQSHMKESEKTARQTADYFINVGIIAVFGGIAVAFYMNRIIAKPLIDISRVAERITSGDLTVSHTVEDRSDEVGALSQTFRTMVERLQKQTFRREKFAL